MVSHPFAISLRKDGAPNRLWLIEDGAPVYGWGSWYPTSGAMGLRQIWGTRHPRSWSSQPRSKAAWSLNTHLCLAFFGGLLEGVFRRSGRMDGMGLFGSIVGSLGSFAETDGLAFPVLKRGRDSLRSKKNKPAIRRSATPLTHRPATTSPVVVQSTDTCTFPCGTGTAIKPRSRSAIAVTGMPFTLTPHAG